MDARTQRRLGITATSLGIAAPAAAGGKPYAHHPRHCATNGDSPAHIRHTPTAHARNTALHCFSATRPRHCAHQRCP